MESADDPRMKRESTCLDLLNGLYDDDHVGERALIDADMDGFRQLRREDVRPAVLHALGYAVVKYGITQTGGGLMKRIYDIGKMAGLIDVENEQSAHSFLNLQRTHFAPRLPDLLPSCSDDSTIALPEIPPEIVSLVKPCLALVCRVGFGDTFSVPIVALLTDEKDGRFVGGLGCVKQLPIVVVVGRFTELCPTGNPRASITSPHSPHTTDPSSTNPAAPASTSTPSSTNPTVPASASTSSMSKEEAFRADDAREAILQSNDPLMLRACQIVFPSDPTTGEPSSAADRSKRRMFYSSYESQHRYPADFTKCIARGASIGTTSLEPDRGTIGLFIQPEDEEKNGNHIHFLTCAHCAYSFTPDWDLLPTAIPETTPPTPFPLVSPGSLDIAKRLHDELVRPGGPRRQKVEQFLSLHGRVCGSVVALKLGVDEGGNRQDWALVKVAPDFAVDTAICWQTLELKEILCANGQEVSSSFRGNIVEVVQVEKGANEKEYLWLKNGTTTGWSSGSLMSTEAKRFIKGTIIVLDDERTDEEADYIHANNVVTARVCVFAMPCDAGDSGGEVVRVVGDGFGLGAMALSKFDYGSRSGRVLMLAVEASILMGQVKAVTGKGWKVCH